MMKCWLFLAYESKIIAFILKLFVADKINHNKKSNILKRSLSRYLKQKTIWNHKKT